MAGARLVHIANDCATRLSQRSRLTSMPAAQRSAKTRAARANSSMDWRMLYAMTGIITLSSNVEPHAAAQATVASLPMAWAATCRTISLITGLTLPGMIELPGWVDGMEISPTPQRGPEASHRISLAILVRLTAMVLSWPEASTIASL